MGIFLWKRLACALLIFKKHTTIKQIIILRLFLLFKQIFYRVGEKYVSWQINMSACKVKDFENNFKNQPSNLDLFWCRDDKYREGKKSGGTTNVRRGE